MPNRAPFSNSQNGIIYAIILNKLPSPRMFAYLRRHLEIVVIRNDVMLVEMQALRLDGD